MSGNEWNVLVWNQKESAAADDVSADASKPMANFTGWLPLSASPMS